ncbi:MAG: TonB-dependent receptor [Sphingobium sp.]
MPKYYPYSILSGASLAALAMVATPAAAQGVDETIVVTARRVEERLQDVPISITVFNQQQLTNRNVLSAVDMSTYTPSLAANTRFGQESASFSLRGFTQEGQTSPSVAVYFADVTAPRAQGGTSGGNGSGVGSFFDLSNVQVLKGPQGTLFGRNTTGGAVLLVPQKPTGRFEGFVEGTYGNYDQKRIQAVVNVPVMESLRIRVGIDRNTRDGYLNNVSGIGPRDFNDVDYTAVRFSAVADLAPNLENYTIVSYGISSTNGSYPKIFNRDNRARDPFPALRIAQIEATSGDYYDVSNGNPFAHQRIKQWSIINTTTWQASDTLTLKNIASYAEFRQAQTGQIYGENGYQNGTALPYNAVNVNVAPGSNNIQQSTFTEEVQLQGRTPNDRLSYQFGAYLELSEPLSGFQDTYSANSLACTNIYAFQCTDILGGGRGFIQESRSKYRFRNLGVYGQATFKFTDTLSLTGGIRYTSDIVSGLGQVLKITFPTPNNPSINCSQPIPTVQGGTSAQVTADNSRCDFRRRVASAKPTWLVGLDWKPVEDVLLYGKYSRGYRQGGVNVSSFGLETWGPEKVDVYEVGLKASFDSFVRGTFNIAGFYNDFSNQQIAINTVSCGNIPPAALPAFPACNGIPATEYPSPAQGIGNAGSSTIKGVEVDASITPFTGLRIDGSYAYLDTKLKTADIANIPIPRGFAQLAPNAIVNGPLSFTPKNKFSITGTYTLPLPETVGSVSVSGTFTHQDSSIGNASSLLAQPAFTGGPLSYARVLPSQDNLNVNLNWNNVAGGPIDLALFGTNIMKEKFITYTTGASFGWDAAVLNQPRMYGVRLKYRFGT